MTYKLKEREGDAWKHVLFCWENVGLISLTWYFRDLENRQSRHIGRTGGVEKVRTEHVFTRKQTIALWFMS